jgi:hypothetical protein
MRRSSRKVLSHEKKVWTTKKTLANRKFIIIVTFI